jgi:hypothetical protein
MLTTTGLPAFLGGLHGGQDLLGGGVGTAGRGDPEDDRLDVLVGDAS